MKSIVTTAIIICMLASYLCRATIIVPEMCENITRRTYLISRLERIMYVLKKCDTSSMQFSIDENFFKHPTIIAAIARINESNNLDSLFTLWQRLKEYKNIDDFLIIQEFTKLVLVVSYHLYPYKTISEQAKLDIHLFLEGTTYVEAVTLRYYYSQRLKKAITFLNYVPCVNKDFFEQAEPGCNCLFITNYAFHNTEIKKIINDMNRENTLNPLIKLANEFDKLKLISDSDFQKEFMLLIFTAYRNLIINNALRYHYPIKKSTLETIAYLYENIEKIPIEQILDAIDLLAEELPIILEKYEFNTKMSWKKWFQKYWWMTSLALTGLSYKILRIFYNSKLINKPAPLSKPRPNSANLLNEDELP